MPSKKPIFLALPHFNDTELARQESLVRALHAASGTSLGHRHIFLAESALGQPGVDLEEDAYVEGVLEGLEAAEVVVAVLDGRQVDDGTAWVMGHAHARGVPVYGVWSDQRQVAHPVVVQGCTRVTGDVRELAGWLSEHVSRVGDRR